LPLQKAIAPRTAQSAGVVTMARRSN